MRIANGTLVLVADGTKMLLLRNDGDAKYPVLTTLRHEEIDNPTTREQGTDAPGRSFSSMGDGRSAYSDTDWHRQAQEEFAREAANTLRKIASSGHGTGSGDIVVIAPPRMLGELRKHYGAAIEKCLLAEIDKDLAGHETDDIIAAIAAHGQ